MRTQANSIRSGIATAFVVAVSTLAAGCADLSNDLGDSAMEAGLPVQNWDDVKGRPQVEVTPVVYRHNVNFASGSAGLSRAEESALRAFLAGLSLNRDDDVFLVGPQVSNALATRRQQAVSSFLLLNKANVQGVAVDPAIDPAAPDTLGVVVQRYTVKLPPCPNWTHAPKDTFSNRPAGNWGCTTATNLGMMVARPSDLVRGRDLGEADGTVQARAVKLYRAGKTKGLIRDAGSSDVFPAASGSE